MKVVLQQTYRPIGALPGAQSDVGDTIDLPDPEAKRALELGIAKTPADAAKTPEELAAVTLLTDLGYKLTPPKVDAPKEGPKLPPAPAGMPQNPIVGQLATGDDGKTYIFNDPDWGVMADVPKPVPDAPAPTVPAGLPANPGIGQVNTAADGKVYVFDGPDAGWSLRPSTGIKL